MSDAPPVRWRPDRTAAAPPWPIPPLPVAMWRGVCGRCPACGQTRLFQGFLRVTPVCANCNAPLGLARADDAPPYFTIVIVAHIVITGLVWLERSESPPMWVQAAIWIPATIILAIGLLRPVKGATVGLMLRLGMLKTESDS